MLRFQNARRKRFSSSCFKHCIRLKASRSLKTRQLHWLCHRRFMRHFKMRSRTFLFRICHVFFQRSSHVCYESLPRARAGRSVIEKSSHCLHPHQQPTTAEESINGLTWPVHFHRWKILSHHWKKVKDNVFSSIENEGAHCASRAVASWVLSQETLEVQVDYGFWLLLLLFVLFIPGGSVLIISGLKWRRSRSKSVSKKVEGPKQHTGICTRRAAKLYMARSRL